MSHDRGNHCGRCPWLRGRGDSALGNAEVSAVSATPRTLELSRRHGLRMADAFSRGDGAHVDALHASVNDAINSHAAMEADLATARRAVEALKDCHRELAYLIEQVHARIGGSVWTAFQKADAVLRDIDRSDKKALREAGKGAT